VPSPKKPRTLPIILSPEEVVQFLGCVVNVKQRTILTTCYAAGLRISEAVHLMPGAIDRQRMVIRIDQGKGRKDRSVMLSPKLLQVLIDYWHAVRPRGCLFPGISLVNRLPVAQSNWLVRQRTPAQGFPSQ
jgi:integrase/recombinase XerD